MILKEVLLSKVTGFVTEAKEEYVGSITIGEDIMDEVGFFPSQKVDVNGRDNRIATYVLRGKPGVICLNGNAATKFKVGEKVHILAYGLTDGEIPVSPRIAVCSAEVVQSEKKELCNTVLKGGK